LVTAIGLVGEHVVDRELHVTSGCCAEDVIAQISSAGEFYNIATQTISQAPRHMQLYHCKGRQASRAQRRLMPCT
jgi:hypothetical protein